MSVRRTDDPLDHRIAVILRVIREQGQIHHNGLRRIIVGKMKLVAERTLEKYLKELVTRNLVLATEREIIEMMRSIERFGQLEPIVVNEKGEILTGYTRTEACRRLGIPPKFVVKRFDNKEAEKRFVIETNMIRRQLTAFQRIEVVALHIEPFEQEHARMRQEANLKHGSRSPLVQIFADGEKGRVRAILAPYTGVSETTYYRGSWLVRNAPGSMLELLRNASISIDRAYSMLQAQKINEKPFSPLVTDMGDSTSLICASLKTVRRSALPGKLGLVFPSADLSCEPKLAMEIGRFAMRFLNDDRFLVVYARDGAIGSLWYNIKRNAKGLELLHVIKFPLGDDWLNVDSAPIVESSTATYLIFWKPNNVRKENFATLNFDDPPEITPVPLSDNPDHLIRPLEANPEVLKYLVESLQISEDEVVCDPACRTASTGVVAVDMSLAFVGIEQDEGRFRSLKMQFEEMLKIAALRKRKTIAIQTMGLIL